MQATSVYPQAALGFRAWKCGPGGHLHSLATHVVWQPGINVASCVQEHFGPVRGCRCGLHAYHDLDDAVRLAIHHSGVVGLVAARGRLQIHRSGFRAQQAVILGLVRHGAEDPRLAVVSALYDVPLLTAERIDHCLQAYHPQATRIAEALRPNTASDVLS